MARRDFLVGAAEEAEDLSTQAQSSSDEENNEPPAPETATPTQLPEGWTMGKADVGLSTDCLLVFINTGARCLAKPIEFCAPDSVMVSGSDERKILPHATSTASLRATAGAASRLV